MVAEGVAIEDVFIILDGCLLKVARGWHCHSYANFSTQAQTKLVWVCLFDVGITPLAQSVDNLRDIGASVHFLWEHPLPPVKKVSNFAKLVIPWEVRLGVRDLL